ncbi:uncharacterized protein K460DRAFT_401893 [Cucurbitaria berberidis CBS 394.84]|uniref:Uncharacterized protein n=1 Tax=Cucurbitaria berberidis CBS 394.84 TaxID=1168544 RepID=A0A9P4GST6_9PLEO|nr:uncharacterized protein K460DRAFT_401893 [Cucurbitaria berberidis CBS 394.84]KAF1851893.1 hypothetical protein K460DRAFT_401893 [Cucurbitaria berberidis CBS 394.84]
MAPTSAQQLQQNAAVLEDVLNNNMSRVEMRAHEISHSGNPVLEARVFQVASRIALQFATQLHWSNFHTWESFRHINTREEALEHAPHFWDSIHPFSTCLGMASTVTTALQTALSQEADLAKYADDVQLVTDCTVEAFKISRRFHCITMVRFRHYCIVIDLVAQPTAFKVGLTSIYTCQKLLTFLEDRTLSFEYAYISGPNSARMLVSYSGALPRASPDSFRYGELFTGIEGGIQGGIINYAFLAAKTKRTTPLGDMPSRRTLQTRDIWDYEPTNRFVTYTPLEDGKFLVDTIVLRIDIIEQQLVLQLPYIDWLAKPNNLHFLERMKQYSGFKQCKRSLKGAVAYLYLPLGTGTMLDLARTGLSQDTVDGVQLVDDVCAALGLPAGEVLRIVQVVADFWAEALANHHDKSISNEAWGSAIISDRVDS